MAHSDTSLLRAAISAIGAIGLASCSPIRVPPPPSVAPSAIGRTLTRDATMANVRMERSDRGEIIEAGFETTPMYAS